tara:strand:+ start:6148 stop:6390 length:243 start_codon:yes stop_codon:yes gene_type:complete
MKCKGKQTMSNPQQITMKNGRPATQGILVLSVELKCSRLVKLHSLNLYILYKVKIAKRPKVLFAILFKGGIFNYGTQYFW